MDDKNESEERKEKLSKSLLFLLFMMKRFFMTLAIAIFMGMY